MTDDCYFVVKPPFLNSRSDGGVGIYQLKPEWIQNTILSVQLGQYLFIDPSVAVPITNTDTILSSFGKIQAQINYLDIGNVTVTSGIVASPSTTQVGATALTTNENFIDTANVTGASVMLLPALKGTRMTVQNNGTHDVDVYPMLGRNDNIYGLAANVAIVLPAGATLTFVSDVNGQYRYR